MGQTQLTSADTKGSGPNDWGVTGCTIRTDSHGTVSVFAEMAGNHAVAGSPPPKGVKTAPRPANSAHVMFQSSDGGATWGRARMLFRVTYPCVANDPLSGRCVSDGYTGFRSDLAGVPSVDLANGAPTGADATNVMIDGWADGSAGVNHEQARVTWSSDGGRTWHAPVAVSAAGDRPIYAAAAISPAGDRAYVVYEAVTSPWRGTDVTSPRPYHGVLVAAAVMGSGPRGWTTVYDGPLGDVRASFPGHELQEERVGDYIYAAASRQYGIGVWIDVRNAAVCPAIQDWRARSLAAGQPVLPAPWPLADCPATFGNTDVWGCNRQPGLSEGPRERSAPSKPTGHAGQ